MIATVGSINMDLVVQVKHHPEPGETILGSDYTAHPGGKGANQAVAASRLGGRVQMIGRVGKDVFGKQLLEHLNTEEIDVRWVEQLDVPSGVAFISVDDQGQNSIIVAPGANKHLGPDSLVPQAFEGAKVILLQLETPLLTVRAAGRLGKQAGATTILNAAPATSLDKRDLEFIDVLAVNEIEAGMLLNKARPQNPDEALAQAADLSKLVPSVIITLGKQGTIWKRAGDAGEGYQEPFRVEAVDTTAAGDAFLGALAVALAEEQSLKAAVRWASAAGALAATKVGAQPSLPRRDDIEQLLMEDSG